MRYLLPLAVIAALNATPARAETTNCTEITSLPATLSSSGIYCLKQDLATAISSGAAITIAANNVVLDCNQHKVGGLAAGPATTTSGVMVFQRMNAVVRGCNLRGFRHGISLYEGGGHDLENNRIDGSTTIGINSYYSEGVRIRGNHVVDTGGAAADPGPIGIKLNGGEGLLVEGNLVAGVWARPNTIEKSSAVAVLGSSAIVRDNNFSNIASAGNLPSYGVFTFAGIVSALDNASMNRPLRYGYGILGGSGGESICRGNVMVGFADGAISNCQDGGGNAGHQPLP